LDKAAEMLPCLFLSLSKMQFSCGIWGIRDQVKFPGI
jgi:hypothetical protein